MRRCPSEPQFRPGVVLPPAPWGEVVEPTIPLLPYDKNAARIHGRERARLSWGWGRFRLKSP